MKPRLPRQLTLTQRGSQVAAATFARPATAASKSAEPAARPASSGALPPLPSLVPFSGNRDTASRPIDEDATYRIGFGELKQWLMNDGPKSADV